MTQPQQAEPKPSPKDDVLASVRGARERAEAYVARQRPWDTRLLILSIVFGTLATVLAGGAAARGNDSLKPFGGKWRPLCYTVACFSAVGTVASALHKGFNITARVTAAERCVSRLRILEMQISGDIIDPKKALEAFAKISDDCPGPLA